MIRAKPDNLGTETLELTPLIDIIFIVVVFLLLTSNSRLISLPLTLPQTEEVLSTAELQAEQITITIQSELPQWTLQLGAEAAESYAQWTNLKADLAPLLVRPSTSITIAVASGSRSDELLTLLSFLNASEFKNIQLLMEPTT